MYVKQAMHQGIEWQTPDTPISDLARIMKDKDIGAVPITENDRLVGIVTDRDITCRAIAGGCDVSKVTARDVMTRDVVFCSEEDDVEDAIHLMEQKQVRRLPVLSKEERPIGMLALGDLSHAVSRELSGELMETVAGHH